MPPLPHSVRPVRLRDLKCEVMLKRCRVNCDDNKGYSVEDFLLGLATIEKVNFSKKGFYRSNVYLKEFSTNVN